MPIQNYKIKGMHCASCANIIERKLKKIEGIGEVNASYATESAQIDQGLISINELNKVIIPLGYSLEHDHGINKQGIDHKSGKTDNERNSDLFDLKKKVIFSVPIVIFSAIVMASEIFGKEIAPFAIMARIMPILAVFMLIYVGKPYLLGVWRFARHRQANMDTLIGIGTLTAFIYSFAITAFNESLRPWLDVDITYYDVTIIVIGFITLGKYLEARAKAKTSRALKALLSLQAKFALV